MAAGWSPELFWDLTLQEVGAVLDRDADRERAANLRAGLVAATIVNVYRKKGTPLVHPSDFLKQPIVRMSPEEAAAFMDTWAQGMNETFAETVMEEEERADK